MTNKQRTPVKTVLGFIRVPDAAMQANNEALARQSENMRRIRERYGQDLNSPKKQIDTKKA